MEVRVVKSDITTFDVDVIVNAANSQLCGGHGVDGAIHKAAGFMLLGQCMRWRLQNGPLETGEVMMTDAFDIPSKAIIHTVAPIVTGNETEDRYKYMCVLLRNCYINSLDMACNFNFKSIVFPNLGTGYFNFPKQEAAEIVLDTLEHYHAKNDIDLVYLTCVDKENYDIYRKLFMDKYNVSDWDLRIRL